MSPFRQIWSRFAGLRLFMLPPDAGRWPEWTIWLAAVAWIAALAETLRGVGPHDSLLILFGVLGMVACPLWLQRVRMQAACVAVMAMAALPVLLLWAERLRGHRVLRSFQCGSPRIR